MNRRFWSIGIVWCSLVLLSLPAWAQFGGGRGGGELGGGGLGGGGGAFENDDEYGPPISVELTGGTLGQFVELLRAQVQKADKEEYEPVSILLSDKLNDLKIGDVKLTDVTTSAALRAVAQLTNQAFHVEPIGSGRILVVRPTSNQVVVRAIRLSWMDEPIVNDMSSMLSLVGGGATPEAQAEREKWIARQKEEYELRTEHRTAELLKSIDEVFHVHAEVSGNQLPLPKIITQRRLGMMMVVGNPESVTIAAEIIEATSTGASRGRINTMPGNPLGAGRRIGGLPGGAPQPSDERVPDPTNDPNKP